MDFCIYPFIGVILITGFHDVFIELILGSVFKSRVFLLGRILSEFYPGIIICVTLAIDVTMILCASTCSSIGVVGPFPFWGLDLGRRL